MARAYYSVDKAVLSRFYEVFVSGMYQNDEESSAILLRNRLLDENAKPLSRTGGGNSIRRSLYNLSSTALQLFVDRKHVKVLKSNGFEFPLDP